MDAENLINTIISLQPACRIKEQADRPSIEVAAENLPAIMETLCNNDRLAFDMLLDHTAIDHEPLAKFELVYNLYSTLHGHYLMVTCDIERQSALAPTMSMIWSAAHWQEREVYDLFGIRYEGHSDLRRIFLEDDWQGHPLRKDYKDPDMLEFEK
ncbi:MAG: hypothetical protein A2Y07_08520 [Planctomycetes bacterium GWF2_50_10]|nr:MAG: hypothetical protein A2Y07_08520 [Planctomycetes bacterium GWF2_50_10]